MRKNRQAIAYATDEEGDNKSDEEDEDDEEGKPGAFYLRFKEMVPSKIKKDMSIEDMWVLVKRPIVTS